MGQPAARKNDPTLHGGFVASGHPKVIMGGQPAAYVGADHSCPIHTAGPVVSGSDRVIIGGQPAARVQDTAACVPASLKLEDIAASAAAALPSSADPRVDLTNNDDARRRWLHDEAVADRDAGASALEVFSNTIQRSRWANTKTGFFGASYIDKNAAASDIGLVFAGYDGAFAYAWDAGSARIRGTGRAPNNTYNVNHPIGLPFTGFKEEFRDDDPESRTQGLDDQTHHVAFFTMIGAEDGSLIAKLGSVISDPDAARDRVLGYEGGMLGERLGDVDLDINAYIWARLGDPTNGPSKKSSDVIVAGCEKVVIGVSSATPARASEGDIGSLSRAGSISNSHSPSGSSQ